MRFLLKHSLVLGLMISLSACSSSSISGDSEGGDEFGEAADAGTDGVPKDAAEAPSSDNASTTEATPEQTAAGSQDTPPPLPAGSDAPMDSPAPEVVASSGGSGQMDRVVRRGDTLMKIAYDVYGDISKWKDIYSANKDKISDPNMIPSGLTLSMEAPAVPFSPVQSGEKYMIKRGDTLGKISDALYGAPGRWKELWKKNKTLIKDPNKIFAGFFIYYNNDGARVADSGGGAQEDSVGSNPTAQSGSQEGSIASSIPDLPSMSGLTNQAGTDQAPSGQ